MKIFSFNTFFGLEQELTEHPETVIFAAMYIIIMKDAFKEAE